MSTISPEIVKDKENKGGYFKCLTCGDAINVIKDDCIALEKVSNWGLPLPTVYFCSWACAYQFVKKLNGKEIDNGWKIQGYSIRSFCI